MQPVDLLALPFHAQRLMEEHADQRIVFAGLSTTGEPCLEFRVETREAERLTTVLQSSFDRGADSIRQITQDGFRAVTDLASLVHREQDTVKLLLGLVGKTLALPANGPHFHLGNVDNMSNYTNYGQAGVVGAHAEVGAITMAQLTASLPPGVTASDIHSDLDRLAGAMRSGQTTEDQAGQHAENVTAARVALQSGDAVGALKWLKAAGKWSFDFATKVGASLAASLLKHALSLP